MQLTKGKGNVPKTAWWDQVSMDNTTKKKKKGSHGFGTAEPIRTEAAPFLTALVVHFAR